MCAEDLFHILIILEQATNQKPMANVMLGKEKSEQIWKKKSDKCIFALSRRSKYVPWQCSEIGYKMNGMKLILLPSVLMNKP